MLKRLLVISRPVAWASTALAYLVGIGSFSNFTVLSIVELLFMLFPINFIVYGLNDVYDRKSDKINPNKDDFQGAKIRSSEIRLIKNLSISLSIIFIVISVLSGNIEHILMAATIILLVFIYSAPPLRIKARPFIDSLFAAIGYSMPILLAFTLHNSLLQIPSEYFLFLIPLIAGHSLYALRDEEYDRKAGAKTTAVFLGRKKILLLICAIYLLPIIIFSSLFLNNLFVLAIFLNSILFVTFMLIANLKSKNYVLILAACIFFSVNLIFIYFILNANLI